MYKINELISKLVAIKNFAKDIHYTVHGEAFYGKHLFVDLINKNIDTYIDDIKEVILLGNETRPLSSKEYLKEAVNLIPEIKENDDSTNFNNMLDLISKTLGLISGINDFDKADNNLIDDIARDLQKSKGLLNLYLT